MGSPSCSSETSYLRRSGSSAGAGLSPFHRAPCFLCAHTSLSRGRRATATEEGRLSDIMSFPGSWRGKWSSFPPPPTPTSPQRADAKLARLTAGGGRGEGKKGKIAKQKGFNPFIQKNQKIKNLPVQSFTFALFINLYEKCI